MAGTNVTTERERMEGWRELRLASLLQCHPLCPLVSAPSCYLQWLCEPRSLHVPLHFGEGDREEIGEGGGDLGAVADGNL